MVTRGTAKQNSVRGFTRAIGYRCPYCHQNLANSFTCLVIRQRGASFVDRKPVETVPQGYVAFFALAAKKLV